MLTPLVDLLVNLRLTEDGFHFENHLMDQILRLPMSKLQALEKGTAIERLTNESSALMCNQLILHTRPFVLLGYGFVVVSLLITSDTHMLYFIAIFVISFAPLLRSLYLGRRRAELRAQTARYTELRKNSEQELFESRDLAWGFPVGGLLIGNIRTCHNEYWNVSGKKWCHLNALESMLDFLCGNGVKMAIVVFGAVLVSKDMMSLGSLLGGFLMQPAIAKCCKVIYRLIMEYHNEKQYLDRMLIMYDGLEDRTEEASEETKPYCLELKQVSFSYPGQAKPAIDKCSIRISEGEVVWLSGRNGSGKSTILQLLGGIQVPDGGKLCDETGRCLEPEILYKNVSFCQQNGAIFSGTVEENLFLNKNRIEEAEEMLASIGFEKPLTYIIEPGGSNLSYGERKKILLVRALLKDAAFLALDEPLNHLDECGKAFLTKRLENYNGAIIYISHEALELHRRKSKIVNVECFSGGM
ncbi:MAG: ATP-binding cassette domain-containing protein [Lachnospiraceae bacterium]